MARKVSASARLTSHMSVNENISMNAFLTFYLINALQSRCVIVASTT